jgi:hypothetical protein
LEYRWHAISQALAAERCAFAKSSAMQDFESSFDSEALLLMGRVCDELWAEVKDQTVFISVDIENEVRRRMALRVLAAVAGGERDPLRLKAIGFNGSDR